MRRIFEALGCGFAVYVVMAACSESGSGHAPGKKKVDASVDAPGGGGSAGVAQLGGAGGVAGVTGAGGVTDSGDPLDALIDALTDPVPDAMANESGSRLKARRYIGADGAKEWIGWHDTKRDIHCTTQLADDGKMRCMPAAAAGFYFADAACTQPLGLLLDCGVPKEVSRYTPSPQCTSAYYQYAAWSVGTAVAPTTVYNLGGAPEVCKSLSWSSVPGYTLRTLTKVAASEYAEMTEAIDN